MLQSDIRGLIIQRHATQNGERQFKPGRFVFDFTEERKLHMKWPDRTACIDCTRFDNDQVAEILETLRHL